MLQPWMIPADLMPGDAKSRDRDWSDLEIYRVESADDPLFDEAYGTLWSEFGETGELEQAPVLAKRLLWEGHSVVNDTALRYRLLLFKSQGQIAAVCDYTAIIIENHPGVVVHLSHHLVVPAWRRTGLAGWLRTLPVQTARNALKTHGYPDDTPITLVGEVEYPDPQNRASLVRLQSFEKAGFLKINPLQVNYLQPDFRSPEEIDLDGTSRPLSLSLIVRRVGRESETAISGKETRHLMEAIYRMYRTGFRPQEMTAATSPPDQFPPADAQVLLLPPTSGMPPL